ncbi:MAG: hypothetical protein GXY52_04845 [Chloroflexi bacterium]|nr:hypothetical protein [Chloroflexota bacterium]
MKRQHNSHQHTRDNLSALLDGQLTTHEEAATRAHLAGCAKCRLELQTLEQMRAILREAPRLDAPRSFVLDASAAEQRSWLVRQRQLVTRLYRASSVLAAAILLLAGVAGWRINTLANESAGLVPMSYAIPAEDTWEEGTADEEAPAMRSMPADEQEAYPAADLAKEPASDLVAEEAAYPAAADETAATLAKAYPSGGEAPSEGFGDIQQTRESALQDPLARTLLTAAAILAVIAALLLAAVLWLRARQPG